MNDPYSQRKVLPLPPEISGWSWDRKTQAMNWKVVLTVVLAVAKVLIEVLDDKG